MMILTVPTLFTYYAHGLNTLQSKNKKKTLKMVQGLASALTQFTLKSQFSFCCWGHMAVIFKSVLAFFLNVRYAAFS